MRDTCVSQHITDPHMAWEDERQALKPHFDAIEEMQLYELTDDIDDQLATLCAVENGLIGKITTAPPRTIEGALAVIEAIDHYERETICTENLWTLSAMDARARSVDTIRRCLAEREG